MRGYVIILGLLASMFCQAWEYDTPILKARWVWPQQEAIVGEQVEVYIELATPHWYTKAARISLPLDDTALWLQPSSFAVNSSVMLDQSRWNIQCWPITLLLRKPSIYLGAEVLIEVAVADATGQSIAHSIELKAPLINVVASLSDTLVADQLTILRTVDRPDTWQVGSIFTVSYDIKAEGVLAMFLPELQPQFEGLGGVTVYPSLPTLADNRDRGLQSASRQQRFDVVVNQPGDLTLLPQSVDWLRRQDRQQQTLLLKAQDIITSSPSQQINERWPDGLPWVAIVAILLAMSGLGYWSANVITPLHQYRYTLRQQLLASLAQGDWQTVATCLFCLRDSNRNLRDLRMSQALQNFCDEADVQRIEAILAAAYSAKQLLRDDQDKRRFKQLFARWQQF